MSGACKVYILGGSFVWSLRQCLAVGISTLEYLSSISYNFTRDILDSGLLTTNTQFKEIRLEILTREALSMEMETRDYNQVRVNL